MLIILATLATATVFDRLGWGGGTLTKVIALIVVTALTIQFHLDAANAVMYVFMAAVLLVRPRGLLGERWERFE